MFYDLNNLIYFLSPLLYLVTKSSMHSVINRVVAILQNKDTFTS